MAPIAASLMNDLVHRYGKDEGERIYHAMEAEGKGPFAPGMKYRQLHEDWADKNKVRPSAAIRTKKKGVRSRSKPRKPRRK